MEFWKTTIAFVWGLFYLSRTPVHNQPSPAMFLLELSKADKMLIDNFVHNIINYAASWGRFISIRLYRAKLSH